MLEYHILKRYKYLYWEADKCTGLMDRIKTNLSVWMAAMAGIEIRPFARIR